MWVVELICQAGRPQSLLTLAPQLSVAPRRRCESLTPLVTLQSFVPVRCPPPSTPFSVPGRLFGSQKAPKFLALLLLGFCGSGTTGRQHSSSTFLPVRPWALAVSTRMAQVGTHPLDISSRQVPGWNRLGQFCLGQQISPITSWAWFTSCSLSTCSEPGKTEIHWLFIHVFSSPKLSPDQWPRMLHTCSTLRSGRLGFGTRPQTRR